MSTKAPTHATAKEMKMNARATRAARRLTLEPHPVAQAFPLMSDEEFKALKEDIRRNGQREPIIVTGRLIVDGRNRYRACMQLGLTPRIVEMPAGASPLNIAVSANLARRHLSASQKACVALKVMDVIQPEAIQRKNANLKQRAGAPVTLDDSLPAGDSREIAGNLVGCSGVYVSMAKRLRNADKRLFEAVFVGTMPLSRAIGKIKSVNHTPGRAVRIVVLDLRTQTSKTITIQDVTATQALKRIRAAF